MLILLNKPYGVICQFSPSGGKPTLANYVRSPNVYPAGRLDTDSEGLVALTDDGALQYRIASPVDTKTRGAKMEKSYWVQVEGSPTTAMVAALGAGVVLNDGRTAPCGARQIEPPESIWSRTPPIRERRAIPTAWLELTLSEGKNRQVRRMTAHVGLPTLRLIRHRIGPWALDGLQPGAWRPADAQFNK